MKTAIIVMCAAVAVWANEPDEPKSPGRDGQETESSSIEDSGLAPSATETAGEETSDSGKRGGWGIGHVIRATRQMSELGDWENQVPNIEKTLDRFWEENEWTEEADQFAHEAVRGVAQIPPWEITRRVEFLTGEYGARYDMDESQIKDLQAKCYQMIGAVAVRHGGTMYKHVSEMVEGFQEGKPLTPEDVSRWMDEGDEMIEFAHEQVESVTERIAAGMNDKQRAILERDLASYRKRMERFKDMRERWKAGGWHPREWGLEEVPEYKRMMAQRVRDGRYDEDKWRRFDELQIARRAYEKKSKETPYNETAWERYVREFIAAYYLDDAQAETAWSILREQRQLASDVRRTAQRHLVQGPFIRGRPGIVAMSVPLPEEALDRIGVLFDELCMRLDRIPTDAQIVAAEAVIPPAVQSPIQALPASSRSVRRSRDGNP
ncbi:MAG: hypothetical protein DHS20C16_01720 [Phycisphaerae bacterium]|nr:MAG: hypothetical protein DHS20C16_01720 [Phycisphaerae bacterium]